MLIKTKRGTSSIVHQTPLSVHVAHRFGKFPPASVQICLGRQESNECRSKLSMRLSSDKCASARGATAHAHTIAPRCMGTIGQVMRYALMNVSWPWILLSISQICITLVSFSFVTQMAIS